MRSFTLVRSLLLLVLPIFPATSVRAASAPPIFPPASVFVLPESAVGAPVKALSEPVPNQAVSEIDYEFNYRHNSYLYSVTTFRANHDAVAYDRSERVGSRQVSHPIVPGEWYAIVQPSASSTLEEALAVGFVYRNLNVFVEADIIFTTANRRRLEDEAEPIVLKTASQIYSRAQAFAAHPFKATPTTPSIFPPTSVFVLPESAVGGRTTVTSLSPQGLNSPIKPLSRTAYDLPKQLMQSYKVEIFRSSADAQSSFKYQMTHLPADYRFFKSPPNGRYYYLPSPSGFNIVATVFRNIEFVVSSSNGATPAQDERALLGFTSVLVGRAQSFAARPFKAPPTQAPSNTLSLTPAEQARNKALRTELNYWSNWLTPCVRDTNALVKEYQAHSYSTLDALLSDSQVVSSECSDAITVVNPDNFNTPVPQSPPPPPYYTIAILYNRANIDAFGKLQYALYNYMLQSEGVAWSINHYGSYDRNVGPDLSSSTRQAVDGTLPDWKKSAKDASDTLIKVVKEWHIT